mgnify:CR=1 FL=1
MTIERELATRRHKVAAEDIQRRHRIGQAAGKRLLESQKEQHGPDCVHPTFQRAIDSARVRAQAVAKRMPPPAGAHETLLERLRAEGKLPPKEPGHVGYEPTAEEVLGDLASGGEPSGAPEHTETLPSADEVLSGGDPFPPLPAAERRDLLAPGRAVGQSQGKRKR